MAWRRRSQDERRVCSAPIPPRGDRPRGGGLSTEDRDECGGEAAAKATDLTVTGSRAQGRRRRPENNAPRQRATTTSRRSAMRRHCRRRPLLLVSAVSVGNPPSKRNNGRKKTKQRRPTRRERRGGRPRSRRPLHADSGGGDEKCAARANRIESWRNDVPLRAAPRLTDVTHGDAGVGLDSGAEIVSAAPIDRPNQSELRYSSKPNCPAVRRGRRALRTQPTPRTSASSSSWRR